MTGQCAAGKSLTTRTSAAPVSAQTAVNPWQHLVCDGGKREERERETDRQTDREADRQRDRAADRERQTDRGREETEAEIDRHRDRPASNSLSTPAHPYVHVCFKPLLILTSLLVLFNAAARFFPSGALSNPGLINFGVFEDMPYNLSELPLFILMGTRERVCV